MTRRRRRQSGWRLIAAVTVAIVAPAAAARAATVSAVDGWLAWSSPAQLCGDAATFAARVERALGRSPTLAAAGAHVNVTAKVTVHPSPDPAAGGSRWVGEVRLRGDDRRDLGTRTLDRRDISCQPLLEAMALVTALALSDDVLVPAQGDDLDSALAGASPAAAAPAASPPEARTSSAPEPDAPPPSPGPPDTPPPATPAPTPSRTRVEPAASLVGAPAPPLPSSSRRWRSGVEGGPKLGVGQLPGVAFGAELSTYLMTASGWRFFLSFVGWQRQTSLDDRSRGASFQRLESALGVCPWTLVRGRWQGSACLAGDVGRLNISSVGFPAALTQDRLVLDAGLGAALNRRLVGPLAVGVTVGVTVPLIRDRINYGTTDGSVVSVFQEAPVALVGSLRLSVAF